MKIRFALACCTALVVHQTWAAAPALVPIEAFVEEETYSQPRLSPDGQHIAINVRIMRNGRKIPTMTVFKLPSLEPVSRVALQGFEIPMGFSWLTNRRLVLLKGLEIGTREQPVPTGELVALDLDGTNQQYLYGYKARAQSSRGERYGNDYGYGEINHIPRARDGHVQVSAHLFEGNRSMLYDINTVNAIRKLLADIPMKDMGFLSDKSDKPVSPTAMTNRPNRYYSAMMIPAASGKSSIRRRSVPASIPSPTRPTVPLSWHPTPSTTDRT